MKERRRKRESFVATVHGKYSGNYKSVHSVFSWNEFGDEIFVHVRNCEKSEIPAAVIH